MCSACSVPVSTFKSNGRTILCFSHVMNVHAAIIRDSMLNRTGNGCPLIISPHCSQLLRGDHAINSVPILASWQMFRTCATGRIIRSQNCILNERGCGVQHYPALATALRHRGTHELQDSMGIA